MGGWTVYCPVCGLTPHTKDISFYRDYYNCKKCEKIHELDGDSFCEDHTYNIPEEDYIYIETVRILMSNGYISLNGTSDWPSPVTCYDENENEILYNNTPKLCSDGNQEGIMIHSVCVKLLNKQLLLNKLTWNQVYNFLYENCEEGNMLLENYDYGFINKRQQQDYELMKNEEWTTKRPDNLLNTKNHERVMNIINFIISNLNN